ncbi:STM4015 family protein [Kitasatospora sp. NPDC054939]
MYHRHPEQFHGLPVHAFPADPADRQQLPEPGAVAWYVALEYDAPEDFTARWEAFLATVDPAGVRAVLIGPWWRRDYSGLRPAIDALVAAADRLPALEALFLADVVSEECEISWLQLCDITSVLTSFPALDELVVRGGSGLGLKPVRHERLRALRFHSGGLPAEVVRGVAAADLPALEELDLWLGVDEYGGDSTLDDLRPFLDGSHFPALRRLGLKNSEYQDEIAAAVAHAPVVAQLSSLGLGMGVLGDEGAVALLEGQPLTHLESLDLYYHYVSEELQQRIVAALPGVAVDLDFHNDEEDPEDRYVAVAE